MRKPPWQFTNSLSVSQLRARSDRTLVPGSSPRRRRLAYGLTRALTLGQPLLCTMSSASFRMPSFAGEVLRAIRSRVTPSSRSANGSRSINRSRRDSSSDAVTAIAVPSSTATWAAEARHMLTRFRALLSHGRSCRPCRAFEHDPLRCRLARSPLDRDGRPHAGDAVVAGLAAGDLHCRACRAPSASHFPPSSRP